MSGEENEAYIQDDAYNVDGRRVIYLFSLHFIYDTGSLHEKPPSRLLTNFASTRTY